MSVRRLAPDNVQPKSFAFTAENDAWAKKEIAKYPAGRQASAIISLLWRAQEQEGYWLSKPAIERIADMLEMPRIRALEVATFYTMFNLAPVGRSHVQLCGTTPCMLRGASALKKVCEEKIGPVGSVSRDGKLSWVEAECLGACCNAPMAQINNEYYDDLDAASFAKLLDDLAAGRPTKPGSQAGRRSSEPVGGLTALTSFYGGDGISGPSSAKETA
jgi:NADH-quinone oxidoreductase subunit E